MNKKLPNVFANKINKKINNNERVYYSNQSNNIDSNKKEEPKVVVKNNKNINQKISDIFNSSRYVYKADVEITLKNEIITKKIIGRNSKNLITYENELIPLEDIIDIKYK